MKEWGDIRYIYNSIMISDLLVGPKYHTCILYSWLIPVRPLGSIGPQPLLASRLFSLAGLRLILPLLPLTPLMFSRFASISPPSAFPEGSSPVPVLWCFLWFTESVTYPSPFFPLYFYLDGFLVGIVCNSSSRQIVIIQENLRHYTCK